MSDRNGGVRHEAHERPEARARVAPKATPQNARTLECDQVIRGSPASRGTETSAEVLVGPPWRMESNAGVNSSGTRLTLTLDGGPIAQTPNGSLRPSKLLTYLE